MRRMTAVQRPAIVIREKTGSYENQTVRKDWSQSAGYDGISPLEGASCINRNKDSC